MAANEKTTVRFTWACCVALFFVSLFGSCESVSLSGFAVSSDDGVIVADGRFSAHIGKEVSLTLFGEDLSSNVLISVTTTSKDAGSECENMPISYITTISSTNESSNVGFVSFTFNHTDTVYMFCLKSNDTGGKWVHQGHLKWLQISTWDDLIESPILPLWLQICIIAVLLSCSALFSGLNLGLMSLDKTELEILKNSGTPREKKYAKSIAPLRKRGNHLLCTILLGNVLVNNTLTILLDDLIGTGYLAIFGATAAIVIFGEIIPQAVCSRYGLAIGAKTVWFTWLFIILTFPVSYPVSKVLDCILGEEMGTVYNRDRLRELIRVTGTDLVKDEVEIIKGALELSKKTVKDIMTKLDDVYMIECSSVLDFQTMSDIIKAGYSRIPVYEKERQRIVGLLNSKDLTFIDPDDKTPLQTVMKFYSHPLLDVFDDTKLNAMLEEFKKGRSHMAVVRKVNNEGLGDPYYETLGVVTLEDIIEEIIQSEIVDETDTIIDNRSKARRKITAKDFTIFNQPDDESFPRMSPQLAVAAYQYLSTSVGPFRNELVSDTALHRLLKCNIMVDVNISTASHSSLILYDMGKPADYFVMILEGRVQVSVGKEQLVFEGGPFMCFAIQALIGPEDGSESDGKVPAYIPDYTVRALTNLQYLCIRRAHYVAVRRATLMERQPRAINSLALQDGGISTDNFSLEWQKALDMENQDASSMASVTASNKASWLSRRDDVSDNYSHDAPVITIAPSPQKQNVSNANEFGHTSNSPLLINRDKVRFSPETS